MKLETWEFLQHSKVLYFFWTTWARFRRRLFSDLILVSRDWHFYPAIALDTILLFSMSLITTNNRYKIETFAVTENWGATWKNLNSFCFAVIYEYDQKTWQQCIVQDTYEQFYTCHNVYVFVCRTTWLEKFPLSVKNNKHAFANIHMALFTYTFLKNII